MGHAKPDIYADYSLRPQFPHPESPEQPPHKVCVKIYVYLHFNSPATVYRVSQLSRNIKREKKGEFTGTRTWDLCGLGPTKQGTK